MESCSQFHIKKNRTQHEKMIMIIINLMNKLQNIEIYWEKVINAAKERLENDKFGAKSNNHKKIWTDMTWETRQNKS